MSRVERTENPSERRGSEQLREAQKNNPNPGHTPTKAEGELTDVEQALENQKE